MDIDGKIYGLYHPGTSDLRYVGQTICSLKCRLKNHCSAYSRRLPFPVNRWIAKLVDQGLRPEIRPLKTGICTKSELDKAETEEIAKQRAMLGGRLLNLAPGGEGGDTYVRTPQQRLHMSKKMMGHTVSAETRYRCSVNAAARRPEVRAKISASRKGMIGTGRKLTNEDVRDARSMFASGSSQSDIAKLYKVTRQLIYQIVRNKTRSLDTQDFQ